MNTVADYHPEDPSSYASAWDAVGEAEQSSHFTGTSGTGFKSRHNFHPTRVIVLSELPTRRKEYFYKLLLSNRAKFASHANEKFVANVRLMGPDVKKSEIASISMMKDRSQSQREGYVNNFSATFNFRLQRLKNEGFLHSNSVKLIPSPHNCPFDYTAYPRFFSLISTAGGSVKPRSRPINWVMKWIEALYENRFAQEKYNVEKEKDDYALESEDILEEIALSMAVFPIFVVRNIGTHVGLRTICDQSCWDLLFNITVYRRDSIEVELFSRFLQEYYDRDELLFFLYVKSIIGKVLNINFKNRWLGNNNSANGSTQSVNSRTSSLAGPNKVVWMSYRECIQVARIVHGYSNSDQEMDGANSTYNSGNDSNSQYRVFLQLLVPHLVGHVQRHGLNGTTATDTRRIDIFEYLHLSVEGFRLTQRSAAGGNSSVMNSDPHQQQQQTISLGSQSEDSRYLQPLPGQLAPTLPVPNPSAEIYSHHQYEQQQRQKVSQLPSSQRHVHPLQQKLQGQHMASARYLLGSAEEEERNAPMDLEEDEDENYEAVQRQQDEGNEGGGGGDEYHSDAPSSSLQQHYKLPSRSSEEYKAYSQRSQDSYHHIPSKSMDHALPSFDVRDAEEASYFPALASSGLSSSSYTHAVPRPTRAAPTHAAPSSHAVNAPAPVGGSMLSKLFPSEPILVESKKPFAFDGDDDKQNQTNNNNSQQTAMRKVVLSTDSDDRHNHHPSHPPSANNRRASITMAPPVVISAPVPSAAASDKQLRSGEATPSELAETEFDILRREREQEFLNLLCENLAQARLPYQYVEDIERDLADTLNQTVEIFLSDKQIPDLETLDDVLLEVLQLEQLRIDMEAIRDDLIHQYRQYQEDDDQQEHDHVAVAPPAHAHPHTHEEDGHHTFERMYARKSSIFSYSVDPSTAAGLNSRHSSISNANIKRSPSPGAVSVTGSLDSVAEQLKPLSVGNKLVHSSPSTKTPSPHMSPSPTSIPAPPPPVVVAVHQPVAVPPPPPQPAISAEDLPDTLEGRYEVEDRCLEGGRLGLMAIQLKAGISKINRHLKVLIKIVDRNGLTSAEEICLSQEFEVLRAWTHPNIINAYDIFVTDQQIATVMDRCDGGTLMQRLMVQPNLNELIVRDLLKTLLQVVQFMHSQDILHRDIKLIHIVYSSPEDDLTADLKLTGFMHVAEASAFTLTEKCGTLGYIAPEVAEGKPYGKPVDLWSLGVITYTLLGGSLPFQDDDEQKLLTKIKKADYKFNWKNWSKISNEAKDIVKGMLTLDPKRRLTAEQALNHPWILYEDSQKLMSRSLEHNLNELKASFAENPPPRSESTSSLLSKIKKGHFYA